MYDPALLRSFASLEDERGLPRNTLLGMYGIESNFGRAKDRAGSQFQGGFQLGAPVRAKYGVTNPADLTQSARGAADYAKDNLAYLQRKGLPITPTTLYLAHQQGAGGATALLSNPDAPAGTVANPAFIKANGGDPTMPASAFYQRFANMFGRKVNEAGGGREAEGPPMSLASAPAPEVAPAPGQVTNQNPDPSWQDKLGGFSNGLIGAGAALMAINNPSGASALAAMANKGQKADKSWKLRNFTPNGKGMIFEGPNGETRIDPVPDAYQGPKESDVPAEVRTLNYLKDHPELIEVNNQMHPDRKKESNLNGDYTDAEVPQLKIMADLYQRDKAALSKFDQASKAKLFKYLSDNNITGGDVAGGQVEQASNLASGRQLGKMATNMETYAETFKGGADMALKASTEVPRSDWKMWNQFSGMIADQIGDPKWKAFAISNQTLAREYAKAINPQGQPTVSDFDHAMKLLSTADSPEAYKSGVEMMRKEIDRTHERLRNLKKNFKEDVSGRSEDKAGTAGSDTNAPATSAPTSAPQGMPEGAKQGEDGQWYVQQNGKWYRIKPK